MNVLKAIGIALVILIAFFAVGAVIAGLGYAATMISGGVAANTPSQVISVDQYRDANQVSREEAQTDLTLAQADKTVNEGQAAKIEANAKLVAAQGQADSARMESAAKLATATGFQPGKMGDYLFWIAVAAIVIVGIFLLIQRSKS